MSGNQISVRALNLNQDFSGIAHTLDDIIQNSFNNEKWAVAKSLMSILQQPLFQKYTLAMTTIPRIFNKISSLFLSKQYFTNFL